MAAPPDVTCANLSGVFVMNKSLSDDLDAMFILQGLSWFTRKAISLTTVVLTVKAYTKDGAYHIDITSVASGLSTSQENRTLDWTQRDHADRIFGALQGKSRLWTTRPDGDGNGDGKTHLGLDPEGPASEFDKTFLRAEQLKDGAPSAFTDAVHVQSYVHNVDAAATGGWEAEQTWGFEDVPVAGKVERRYTRRVVVWKDDQVQRVRLVYDYKGQGSDGDDADDGLAYGEVEGS